MEENENKFVSIFTDEFDLNCAKIYANKVMNNDPFFNRLTEIRCKDLDNMIDRAEIIFDSIKVKPFIHCISNELMIKLEEHNYKLYDRISVLLLESPYLLKGVESISIEVAEIDEWVRVYTASFNEQDYREEIYNRLMDADLNLYVARVKGKIVGCMALLATKELLGLYCLGVLQEYRRLGVASSLLRYGYDTARNDNKMLFLQTFVSEDLVRYYIKHGFTQMYIKDVYTKAS